MGRYMRESLIHVQGRAGVMTIISLRDDRQHNLKADATPRHARKPVKPGKMTRGTAVGYINWTATSVLPARYAASGIGGQTLTQTQIQIHVTK